LKSEIDISDALVMKFKQFWDHFKDAPLKGDIPIAHLLVSLCHSNSYFLTFCDCLSRYLLFYIVPSLLTPVAGQIWLTTVQVF